jgi:16S rRNA C967 or C1407 C5-methylase (RsmB/RsmF family)
MSYKQFPSAFLKRLEEMYGPEGADDVVVCMNTKPVIYRVRNVNDGMINAQLSAHIRMLGGAVNSIGGFDGVYEVSGIKAGCLTELEEYKQGLFYIQSIASLAIPMVLDPNQGERVLDLCAAPGSKTSQMCWMMRVSGVGGADNNRSSSHPADAGDDKNIVAVEIDGKRCKRLREVLALQGVSDMVEVIKGSGVHLGDEYEERFDKVLVDAPCSADARFDINKPKTFHHWAKWRIKSYALKQKKLLMAGLRYLKPGGVLVYSTCSMNPEENEGVVDYVLKRIQQSEFRSNIEVMDIDLPIERMDPIMDWHGKAYTFEVSKTFRMKPDRIVQPFFVALLQKC